MPQTATLKSDLLDDRRANDRVFIDLAPAQIEGSAMTETVRIVNIARHGFLARSRLSYDCGTRVKLVFADIAPIACRIMWSGKGMVGARFIEPVDLDTLPRA
jgi:hypothetical protein